MSNSEIAVVSITFFPKWYRGRVKSIKHTDKIRGDLALEAIKKASDIGYQVVIVDGKSSASFRKELGAINNIHVIKRRSLKRSPARRMGYKKTVGLHDVKVIVTTEAEKVSFITDCLPLTAAPILKSEADIVVPKRDEELFKKTYPDYQFESETEGNKLYNEYLRSHHLLPENFDDIDIFFGPRAFANNRKILSIFIRRIKLRLGHLKIESKIYDPEEYSNAQFFPIVLAAKKGLRIKSVKVPFKYPLIQKENEEMGVRELFLAKRKMQELVILVELMHFFNYMQKRTIRKF